MRRTLVKAAWFHPKPLCERLYGCRSHEQTVEPGGYLVMQWSTERWGSADYIAAMPSK
jgi:hypothetical protein